MKAYLAKTWSNEIKEYELVKETRCFVIIKEIYEDQVYETKEAKCSDERKWFVEDKEGAINFLKQSVKDKIFALEEQIKRVNQKLQEFNQRLQNLNNIYPDKKEVE